MPKILLEVCIASASDAHAADVGGAERLELNSALPLGGLTPTLGTLYAVQRTTRLPIIAMVRPREGGFCYSDTEFAAMVQDAENLLALGVAGLAFGLLHADGTLDVARNRTLRDLCGNRQAVFHRAFDVVPDPTTVLEQLIAMRFTRVMTSGQEANAYHGTPNITAIVQQAAGRIEILPAGGVNRFTVRDIVGRTGCTQVHASLRTGRVDPSPTLRPQVRFGTTSQPETHYDATNEAAVRELVALLAE